MANRRSLVDGLKETPPVDPKLAADFVFGGKSRTAAKPAAASVGKSPISTRIRSDFAQALKRASLERQLDGAEPNTLQEILEEAIEPWLRTHGYLSTEV